MLSENGIYWNYLQRKYEDFKADAPPDDRVCEFIPQSGRCQELFAYFKSYGMTPVEAGIEAYRHFAYEATDEAIRVQRGGSMSNIKRFALYMFEGITTKSGHGSFVASDDSIPNLLARFDNEQSTNRRPFGLIVDRECEDVCASIVPDKPWILGKEYADHVAGIVEITDER